MLAAFLEKTPELVRNKQVIELGAGAGLVGMVTALIGKLYIDGAFCKYKFKQALK